MVYVYIVCADRGIHFPKFFQTLKEAQAEMEKDFNAMMGDAFGEIDEWTSASGGLNDMSAWVTADDNSFLWDAEIFKVDKSSLYNIIGG